MILTVLSVLPHLLSSSFPTLYFIQCINDYEVLNGAEQCHPNHFRLHLTWITAVQVVGVTIAQEGCSLFTRVNEQWPSTRIKEVSCYIVYIIPGINDTFSSYYYKTQSLKI